ncbi:MAG: GIY-YIG nuclease family protein [Burkholderiales bacterium]|nr:GIY-YIG nuclease family protein [Burkholderiales bacterium]
MDKIKRKALSNAYKLAFPCMGIYCVKNMVTGQLLLGQSNNLPAALNRNRLELRFGSHRNPALLADWRNYGETQFSFDILEQLTEHSDAHFDYQAELNQCLARWKQQLLTTSTLY